MELYDKRSVTCRIIPLADGKDNTQYSIYNKVDTSDLQATSLNIHGFTTSDQSLAGSHTLWIKGQKANKKLKSFGIKAVKLPQVAVAPLRQAEKCWAALHRTGVGTPVYGSVFPHCLH